MVQSARQDIVAANALGRVLYSPLFDTGQQPNIARFIFCDPRAQDFYVDWELARRTSAAMLRREAGRNPLDEDLTAFIGELSARSMVFRRDWAGQNVLVHRTGTKTFRHPDVGLIDADFDVFELPGEPGLLMVTYSTQPGSPSAGTMALLAALTTGSARHPAAARTPAPPYADEPTQR